MNIYQTNGNLLATLADGTASTNVPLTLAGYNYSGYGKLVNENFVKLLENFANDVAPNNALNGQLWYDTQESVLKIKTPSGFKQIPFGDNSALPPTVPTVGDLWWDSVNDQLKVYGNNKWNLIGPGYTRSQGESGIVVARIFGTDTSEHVVLKLCINGVTLAVISDTGSFQWADAEPGFNVINTGVTLNSIYSNFLWNGTSQNSNSLGGVEASKFVRKDIDVVFEKNFTVSGALNISSSRMSVEASPGKTNLTIENTNEASDLVIKLVNEGSSFVALTVGADGDLTLSKMPNGDYAATPKIYVDQLISTVSQSIDSRAQQERTITNANVSVLQTQINTNKSSILATEVTLQEIQQSLALKSDLIAPNFTGIPTAPTAPIGTTSEQLATTEFVMVQDQDRKLYIDNLLGVTSNSINGTLTTSLQLKANIASPVLTGVPQAPTPAAGSNGTQIATTAFVKTQVNSYGLWQGSQKFVSTDDPTSATGVDGDFWFKYQ